MERAEPTGASVGTEPPDVRRANLDLDPGQSATHRDPANEGDAGGGVANAVSPDAGLVPDLIDRSDPAAKTLLADVETFRRTEVLLILEVLGNECHLRLPREQTLQETFCNTQTLALLRHRLLLEAEVGEGVRAVHVDDVPDDLAVADLVKRGDLPLSRIK